MTALSPGQVRRFETVCRVAAIACFVVAGALSRSENLDRAWACLGLGGLLLVVATVLRSLGETDAPNAEGRPEPQSLEKQDMDPKKRPPVDSRWIHLRFDPDGQIPLCKRASEDEEPVDLDLPPENAQAAYRFIGSRLDEQEYLVFARMETRVQDRDGRWWSTETWVDSDLCSFPIRPEAVDIGDMGAAEVEKALRDGDPSVGHVGVYFWKDVPTPWRRAIEHGPCLIRDWSGLIDTRERYLLRIGDTWQVIMLKYQGPNMDIAWLEDEKKFVVRAKQMVLEKWDPDPWTAPPGVEPNFVDIIDDVTLGFLLDPELLCVVKRPEIHRIDWERRYDEPYVPEDFPVFLPSSAPDES